MEKKVNDSKYIKHKDEPSCSLYISIDGNTNNENFPNEVSKKSLEKAISNIEPNGNWYVSNTSCGLIATFNLENDVEKFIQQTDITRLFDTPVQIARLKDLRHRQHILLRDVPSAIPLEDLSSALAKQKISVTNIERCRQYIRVEVDDSNHAESLIQQGLDFFGAARFSATLERSNSWRFNGNGGNTLNNNTPPYQSNNQQNQNQQYDFQQPDGVLQCYRCQGFWHVAANCRHLPRCVRCGEAHSIEFCPRPRNNPICCHCNGPHHAAYRQCPIRLQLSHSTPVSLVLSTNSYNNNSSTSDKSNVFQFQRNLMSS